MTLNKFLLVLLFGALFWSCSNAQHINSMQVNDNVVKNEYPEPAEVEYWSIAAVDFKTGQIGIAGASCTFNVQGIGEIIPGKGAVIVQGMSSDEARESAIALMREEHSLAEIMDEIRNPKYDPENQQYALILLDSTIQPIAFSGNKLDNTRGHRIATGLSVQGNVLVSDAVLDDAVLAFQRKDGTLAEKLVKALEAGANAGGDKRCGEQRARSAFVTVYNKTDNARWPYFHLVVYGTEKGGVPAVDYLVKEFHSLFPQSINRPSTRVYIVPENK